VRLVQSPESLKSNVVEDGWRLLRMDVAEFSGVLGWLIPFMEMVYKKLCILGMLLL